MPASRHSDDVQANTATGADEAREFSRLPFRGRARAVVYAPPNKPAVEPADWEVLTTDLSRGGLSIMHRKKLYCGQQLLLVLTDSSRPVEVCWCCRVWPGLYASGCRFTDATDLSGPQDESARA